MLKLQISWDSQSRNLHRMALDPCRAAPVVHQSHQLGRCRWRLTKPTGRASDNSYSHLRRLEMRAVKASEARQRRSPSLTCNSQPSASSILEISCGKTPSFDRSRTATPARAGRPSAAFQSTNAPAPPASSSPSPRGQNGQPLFNRESFRNDNLQRPRATRHATMARKSKPSVEHMNERQRHAYPSGALWSRERSAQGRSRYHFVMIYFTPATTGMPWCRE